MNFLIQGTRRSLKSISGSSAEDSRSNGTNPPQQKVTSNTNEVPDTNVQVIHDLRLQLQEQEAIVSELHEKGQKLLISNQLKDSEIQMLMTRQAGTEAQLVQLYETTSIQHRELQTCKDNLFRLQPVVQLSDSEILKQYETLCQLVSNWVDDEISRFEDKFGTAAHDTQVIVDGGSIAVKKLLDKVPGAGEYLLGSVIHTKIQQAFFGENVVLFGLHPNDASLVFSTQEHMVKLQPERDIGTINAWRSETLKAMATMPEIVERRSNMERHFTADLFHALRKFFPGLRGEPESKQRLHHDISQYAAQLESNIHLSSTEYRFESMPDVIGCSFHPVKAKFLADITWVDVETRKTLKPDSPVISDCDGFIGKPLLMIEPRLGRQDERGRKETPLRKGKRLIKLDTPLARRNR